jgi:hypothetical protein
VVTTNVDVDDTCFRRGFCEFRKVITELNAAMMEVEQSGAISIWREHELDWTTVDDNEHYLLDSISSVCAVRWYSTKWAIFVRNSASGYVSNGV